ncbi:MAG: helix-turn-helix transcriptional regulator [Clostridia bacterium]|nr:helix-turn-helix transcriptional regulator [Clostridia bacterium]
MDVQDIDIHVDGNDFSYSHSRNDGEINKNFILHNHNDSFETLIFLDGNADFIVEGSVYSMKKGDIVIAGSNELHRMVVRSEGKYERIVITTNYKFFYMLPELKSIFINRKLGTGNLLCLSPKENELIHEICGKIEYYISTYPDDELRSQVIRNLISEIMYLINKSDYIKENIKSTDQRVKQILIYINDHLTERITLDEIADIFFISKYHLCRIFKKHTGMTLTRYINYKRLILAREIHAGGKNLIDSSLDAGFDSYSTFYKIFKKEMGYSPRCGG